MKEHLSKDAINIYFDRIDEKFDEMNKRFDDRMKNVMIKLGEIHEQTSKANERVSKLESWKSTSRGAITAISVFVVPVMLYLLYIHLQ